MSDCRLPKPSPVSSAQKPSRHLDALGAEPSLGCHRRLHHLGSRVCACGSGHATANRTDQAHSYCNIVCQVVACQALPQGDEFVHPGPLQGSLVPLLHHVPRPASPQSNRTSTRKSRLSAAMQRDDQEFGHPRSSHNSDFLALGVAHGHGRRSSEALGPLMGSEGLTETRTTSSPAITTAAQDILGPRPKTDGAQIAQILLGASSSSRRSRLTTVIGGSKAWSEIEVRRSCVRAREGVCELLSDRARVPCQCETTSLARDWQRFQLRRAAI